MKGSSPRLGASQHGPIRTRERERERCRRLRGTYLYWIVVRKLMLLIFDIHLVAMGKDECISCRRKDGFKVISRSSVYHWWPWYWLWLCNYYRRGSYVKNDRWMFGIPLHPRSTSYQREAWWMHRFSMAAVTFSPWQRSTGIGPLTTFLLVGDPSIGIWTMRLV